MILKREYSIRAIKALCLLKDISLKCNSLQKSELNRIFQSIQRCGDVDNDDFLLMKKMGKKLGVDTVICPSRVNKAKKHVYVKNQEKSDGHHLGYVSSNCEERRLDKLRDTYRINRRRK